MRRRLAGLGICLALVAGCGSAEPSRPSAEAEREVRDLVSSYEHALATGDAALACADASPALQSAAVEAARKVARAVATCEQATSLVFRYASPQIHALLGKTRVKGVRVSGDRATILASQAGRVLVTAATKEGTSWKLDEAP
jgi:hypothetical protein